MSDTTLIRGCDGACGKPPSEGHRFVAAGYGPTGGDLIFHTDCVPAYIRELHTDDPAVELRASGLKDENLAAAVIEHVNASEDVR